MRGIGALLWGFGALLFLYAAFGFDVSVASSSEFGGSSRIINMGLQQKQMLLALAGLAMFVAGAFVHAIAEGIDSVRNLLPETKHAEQSDVTEPSTLTDEEISPEEMDRLGITFEQGQFRLGPHRFDSLSEAVARALRFQQDR